jgi:hypothetical protein
MNQNETCQTDISLGPSTKNCFPLVSEMKYIHEYGIHLMQKMRNTGDM